MPKSFNQKIKIMYLMKILQEKTYKDHPVSVNDIIQYMDSYGISVERKTVYDDIETLKLFGMKIQNRRGKNGGYYLAERELGLAELKFLMDAVQSSHFLTHNQTRELLRKLEHLTSVGEARKLKSQMAAEVGIKSVNEAVYECIEGIYEGISDNRQISFYYCEWTLSKTLKQKHNGERYRVSPWELIWKNENYYMLGLDEKSGIVKHYRIDKMMHVTVEQNKRNGDAVFRNFDLSRFSTSTFGMFGGKEQSVRMEFENRFVGVVLDRFGQEVMLIPKDEGHFSVQTRISVSTQFFGWLAGLGTGAVIVSPENIRGEYISFLKKTLANYGESI